jgi:hypothetical protein
MSKSGVKLDWIGNLLLHLLDAKLVVTNDTFYDICRYTRL